MDKGGPYLNAALLCERVLHEKDEVLSVMRIIDRIIVQAVSESGTLPDLLPPSLIPLHLLLVLKSGLYKGNATVKLTIQSPSGVSAGESSVDIFFEGDDRGVNLVSPMQLQVSEDGLYWIDVLCTVGSAESFFTRIPLRVVYQRVSQGSLKWPQGPQR